MREEKDKRPVLYNYFLNQSKKLLVEYEGSKDLQSTKVKCDSREKSLITFLEKILPERLFFHQGGEIWDSQNNQTEEIDIILYRDDCVKIDFGGKKAFLVEGVLAAIEVKSKLDKKGLENSIESLKRIENLQVTQRTGVRIGNTLERPLRIIFAYKSINLDSIDSLIEGNIETIDLICLLDQGALLIKNDLKVFSWDTESKVHWVKGEASALAFLYFYLVTFSSGFISGAPNLKSYFIPLNEWND